MKHDATVLIVENESNMRTVLCALLRRDGHTILEAGHGKEALAKLKDCRVDAVLTDLNMPHMNGLELLAEMKKTYRDIPVVLLTAHGSIGSAVEALKQGAFDYLTKPFDPDEIRQVMDKAVRSRVLQEAETIAALDDDPERLLLGDSSALSNVRHVIDRVAPTSATVMITGESGTGKELVARSLHLRGPRPDGPFIKVNCAAIPESLLESELFGHEKGAFTGAAARKPGRFELAHQGTLFLDEIGEMPLSAQPKLLRALQESKFYRVGGTRTIEVDVRIIAATNRDLKAEVNSGQFREDLFYRLNVVPIQVPSLRQRRADIPELAQFFLERFAQRNQRGLLSISDAALALLSSYPWPGNIRELENVIERASLLTDGPSVKPEDLPDELRRPSDDDSGQEPLRERIRSATRELETDAIHDALDQTGGNITKAAKLLGLSRRGLQLKMKELNIERV